MLENDNCGVYLSSSSIRTDFLLRSQQDRSSDPPFDRLPIILSYKRFLIMFDLVTLLTCLGLAGYTLASRIAAPRCYPNAGQFPAPMASDCMNAMGSLKSSPSYNRPQKFGAYENPPNRLPLDWANRSCLLRIDQEDDSFSDIFPLSSIMPAFRLIWELCVEDKGSSKGWGGLVPIGHGKTFYALVAYNPDWPTFAVDENLEGPSNQTINSTVLQVTQTGDTATA